ncbi:serine hydrolase [Rhizobium sp. FY34]|uniref:serine hydrolase n=1 Tax=Rhizobium sp. FY34 TaxID=2562309 RepID=UPI001485425D|nr:serine hydrolase [Rhizobium sp. FY34]
MARSLRNMIALSLCCLLQAAFPLTQAEASESEIAQLELLFAQPDNPEELFADEFLSVIPEVLADFQHDFGSVEEINEKVGHYVIDTKTHQIPVTIKLDRHGRIEGLLLLQAQRRTKSMAETLAALTQQNGDVSYIVLIGTDTAFARAADKPLAVASSFKLGILKVLSDDIQAGIRRWDDVALLTEANRSLPSGRLQLYPAESPFTLHSLSAAMISESDNTATDILIRVLGRQRIAASLSLTDLLTTREFFQLKADPMLAAQYSSGSEEAYQAVRQILGRRDIPPIEAASGRHLEGVEWYVSAERLCALAQETSTADIFVINAGPVAADGWERVAYKGGNEHGILNLTAALVHKSGRKACVSVTINHAELINETEVVALFARLTEQMSKLP